ncbi:Stalked cell differentiation-controlling protein [Vibrio spartinae]|uniref:Stalked cell differentiation-controlling protein n=1 Tax=Vibrio spartinae TaxID=1918945 RepID=A0ABX6QYS1_9VIBR|nr:Stalked cell differentiation-controlling protein [Vibrio spartinae]
MALSKTYTKFIYFILWGILSIASVSFILIAYQDQKETTAENHAQFFFSSAEQYSDLYVRFIKRSLQAIQKSEVVHDYLINSESSDDQASLLAMIQQLTRSFPAIEQLDILNGNGSSLLRFVKTVALNTQIDFLPSDQEPISADVRQLLKAKPNEIWFSQRTQQSGLIRAQRVMFQAGLPIFMQERLIGVLVVNLDMTEFLKHLFFQPGADIYLLDKHGQILYANRTPNNLNADDHHTPLPTTLAMWKASGFFTFGLSRLLPSHEPLTLAYRMGGDKFYRADKSLLLIAVMAVSAFSIPLGTLVVWHSFRRKVMLNNLSIENQASLNIIDQYIPVIFTDKQARILRCNDAFLKLTGYTKSELLGQSYGMLSDPHVMNLKPFSMFRTLLPGKQWQGELHSQTRSGDELWLHTSIIPRFDKRQNLTGYMAIFTDRTDRKQVERMAERDPLTGIYNRMKLDELMRKCLNHSEKSGQEFAIILIDIDYFKAINDEYGHLVGDNTLIEVTYLLQQSLHKPNEIGRWGGEEFVVICPQSDYLEAFHIANILCKTVSQHRFRQTGQVTISLGVSSSLGKDSVAELLNEADQGLYEAKDRGRCQVVGHFNSEQPAATTQATKAANIELC